MNEKELVEKVARRLTGPIMEQHWDNPVETGQILRMLFNRGLLPDGQLDPATIKSRLCRGFRAYADGSIELICDEP